MKTAFTEIEELIFEKVLLLSDLVDILKEEKKNVQEINVDNLWKFSSAKSEKAKKIEDVRTKLLEALEKVGIAHNMVKETFSISTIFSLLPNESLKKLSGVSAKLILLRQEIHQVATENKNHVKNCLMAVNDMITIMTKDNNSSRTYGRNRGYSNTRQNLFIHREV